MARRNGSSKKRLDVYQEVTDRILAALAEDILPWRKPWSVRNGSTTFHRNFNSKHPYRGVNQFLLEVTAALSGYTAPYWLTYKAAKELGGQVMKGEHGTLVVLWKPTKAQAGDTCVSCHKGKYDSALNCGECGKHAPDKANRLFLRHYYVFNIEQTEGIEIPAPSEPQEPEFAPIERGEQILKEMPQRPKTSHGGNRAFYSPTSDAVRLPSKQSFNRSEDYYATACHEYVHATGHESRLNRPGAFEGSFGTVPYAKEELVAEMGASMLCAVADIDPDVTNTAAYVRNWLSKADYEAALKQDKRLVIQAAARAQKAADFILGEQRENGESHE